MPKILIRADASYVIGTGHIHRTLVLAKRFRSYGYSVDYACMDYEGNLISHIEKEGFHVHTLNNLCEETLINLLSAEPYALLIIDSYQIDAAYETDLKKKTETPILCFDDEGKQHHCDYLLNQNLYADTLDYPLPGKKTKLFCGSEYALLRDEFFGRTPSSPGSNEKHTILLTMGGSDPKAYTLVLLQLILRLSPRYRTTVIAGGSNPRQSEIKAFCDQHPDRFSFVSHTDNMASLMRSADFVISACGSTTLELLYLKKRFLAIVTAENQERIAQYLHTHELASTMNDPNKLSLEQLERLLLRSDRPSSCKIATKDVALDIISDLENISLKRCTPEDSDFLFQLANERSVREASLSTDPISATEHRSWFQKKMQDPGCNIYILYKGETPLATLRTQERGHFITLSLAVQSAHRGGGYAHILLGLYFDTPCTKSHLAIVKQDNTPSNRLFSSNRFTLKKECHNLNFYTRRSDADS